MNKCIGFVILLLLGTGVTCLAGCRPGKPQPVDIVLSEDACAACRMAVSDRKFAAEIVSAQGHVDYFDDLGCLVQRVRAQPPDPHSAIYVVDFNSGAWLDNSTAYFLWSKDMPTPMSFGLAAYAGQDSASAASKQWPGEILRWDELLTRFKP